MHSVFDGSMRCSGSTIGDAEDPRVSLFWRHLARVENSATHSLTSVVYR